MARPITVRTIRRHLHTLRALGVIQSQQSSQPAGQNKTLPVMAASGKPRLRDLYELTTQHLPDPFVKLLPLTELARRCQELNNTYPQYRQVTGLVLAYEVGRRSSHS